MTIQERETEFKAAVNRFGQYSQEMLDSFFDYWSEPNKSNTKMKYELEKTWHLEKRLKRWFNNQKQWYANRQLNNTSTSAPGGTSRIDAFRKWVGE